MTSTEEVERVSRLVNRLRRVWRQTSHPILSYHLARCMDELATAVVNAEKQGVTLDDLRSGGMYGFAAEPDYAGTESGTGGTSE